MFKNIFFITALICSATIMPSLSLAHGEGGHTAHIAADEVVDLASKYVLSLIKNHKKIEGQLLDSSWAEVRAENKSIHRQAAWYYVVSMQNEAQSKALYLMISKKGKLYRANFSGLFKGFE